MRGVYVAQLGLPLFRVPVGQLWTMPAVEKASKEAIALAWARGHSGEFKINYQPPYRVVKGLPRLLRREEYHSVAFFVMQPVAVDDVITLDLAGARYDGIFGWSGRVIRWAPGRGAMWMAERLTMQLELDNAVLYSDPPFGYAACANWDYDLVASGAFAGGWLGRVNVV